jgi:hypothetical protein
MAASVPDQQNRTVFENKTDPDVEMVENSDEKSEDLAEDHIDPAVERRHGNPHS